MNLKKGEAPGSTRGLQSSSGARTRRSYDSSTSPRLVNKNIYLPEVFAARSIGKSRWIALCPAHEDSEPSLSIRRVSDRWLLKCFAGCDTRAVLDAAGLTWADLFDSPLETSRRREVLPPDHPALERMRKARLELAVRAEYARCAMERAESLGPDDSAVWDYLAVAEWGTAYLAHIAGCEMPSWRSHITREEIEEAYPEEVTE